MPSKDPSKVTESYRKYNASEKGRLRRKKWRHSKLGLEAMRRKYKELRRKRRKALIEELGGRCVMCGYHDNIFGLEIDHINGGGKLERTSRRSHQFYRYYLKHLDEAREKLQVMCAICHNIKTWGLSLAS